MQISSIEGSPPFTKRGELILKEQGGLLIKGGGGCFFSFFFGGEDETGWVRWDLAGPCAVHSSSLPALALCSVFFAGPCALHSLPCVVVVVVVVAVVILAVAVVVLRLLSSHRRPARRGGQPKNKIKLEGGGGHIPIYGLDMLHVVAAFVLSQNWIATATTTSAL